VAVYLWPENEPFSFYYTLYRDHEFAVSWGRNVKSVAKPHVESLSHR